MKNPAHQASDQPKGAPLQLLSIIIPARDEEVASLRL